MSATIQRLWPVMIWRFAYSPLSEFWISGLPGFASQRQSWIRALTRGFFTADAFNGKVVLLYFSYTFCPYMAGLNRAF